MILKVSADIYSPNYSGEAHLLVTPAQLEKVVKMLEKAGFVRDIESRTPIETTGFTIKEPKCLMPPK